MNLLYIDAFAGLSGDLFLGALADVGAPRESLESLPERLALSGAKIRFEDVKRRGIAAKQAIVEAPHEHKHRHLKDIQEILKKSDLPTRVKEGAESTFVLLAKAEASVHGTTPEEVHFHEVGAVDAILDIVGTWLAIHELSVDEILCSAVPLSRGQAEMAHGVMPLPAPAVVEILKGAPTRPIEVDFETVTPTGAALAVTLADGFCDWPNITIRGCGWGAATHEGGQLPNLLRLVLGEKTGAIRQDSVWVLECQVDDMNPEFLEPLWSEAFSKGALDLYLTPVVMKKGRQGTLLTVLVADPHRERCERVLLEMTSTFGVRRRRCDRTVLDRKIDEVETEYGRIPVKTATGFPGKAAPEASAVKAAAEKAGVAMSVVYNAALSNWLRDNSSTE